MALFNTLTAELTCPHCKNTGLQDIEFRFGYRDQSRYRLGDRLAWGPGGASVPPLRPDGGNWIGEGYVECKYCKKDYWVKVTVQDDVLKSVTVDPAKKGYLA
jgi:hypothetical protein